MSTLLEILQSISLTETRRTFLLFWKCIDLENFIFLTVQDVSISAAKTNLECQLSVSLCDGDEEGLHVLGSGRTQPGALLRSQVLP